MSIEQLPITPELEIYLNTYGVTDQPQLKALIQKTKKLPGANMQISALQGQFLQILIKSIGAKRILELGTFTGYSALAMALALPEAGYLLTCDTDEETVSVAKHYWEQAGVIHKIESRLGPALQTLDALIETENTLFDFIFIDADKANYAHYYEKSLLLLRSGGLLAIDNVLWEGEVANAHSVKKNADTLHALNQKVHADPRVQSVIIPISDGLTLAFKG